jgi:protein-disulfide isomerase
VNGRPILGAQPEEKFTALIDEELKKARALVAAGTDPKNVYDTIIKGGAITPFSPEKRSVAASPSAPWRGTAGAPVTIVEFADFECPFCKRAEDTLKEVLENYPGKVKIVWRSSPVAKDPHRALAAQAALEARAQKGNAGFYKMHELMLASKSLDRSDLESLAQQAGLDLVKFKHALDTNAHKAIVDEDIAAAISANVSTTPAFFIGPYFLSGPQPYGKFRRVIDLVLKEGTKP